MLRPILLCGITVSSSFAQRKKGQARLDSLLAELPCAKADTNRVKLLCAISYQHHNKGINYANQALTLARRLTRKRGMATAY
ncbi:hypothetical protein [Spirosoma flavum]|uniref:Tetratricopeptide repeat protein n=1 Tax=Spirosoma flavum TaxID=2048557 RepID=A0ABW6ALN7_9BACT